MRRPFVFLLISVLLSCSASKNLPRVTPNLDDLIATSWVLDAINKDVVDKKDYMKGLPALNFREKGILDGMTGCNSFSGKYALGEQFKLDTGAMTKMNCPGSDEKEFLEALQTTTSLLMEGDHLLFMNGNEELLKFSPEPKI